MVLTVIIILCSLFSSSAYGETPDYTMLRQRMVKTQILGKGFSDKRLLEAFTRVKRHLFVKPELRDKAYDDCSLDIGEGQTMSQPYIVAIMTSVVSPTYNKKVLEIGTGSGYSTAILAELVQNVYTIELIESLGVQAKERLDAMGYKNIKFKIGDGYEGWLKYAPYDGIIVTCSEDHIPQALIDQLAVGGRMIIPVSYSTEVQELVLLEKLEDGSLKKTSLIPVEFVPLIRGTNKK